MMRTVKENLTVEPLRNPQGFDSEIAWLTAAAVYFANRPTHGEDRAHWSNVYNAENARKLANRLNAMGGNGMVR